MWTEVPVLHSRFGNFGNQACLEPKPKEMALPGGSLACRLRDEASAGMRQLLTQEGLNANSTVLVYMSARIKRLASALLNQAMFRCADAV